MPGQSVEEANASATGQNDGEGRAKQMTRPQEGQAGGEGGRGGSVTGHQRCFARTWGGILARATSAMRDILPATPRQQVKTIIHGVRLRLNLQASMRVQHARHRWAHVCAAPVR